jgi:hypothetical protein
LLVLASISVLEQVTNEKDEGSISYT